MDNYPNPWSFSNTDRALISSDYIHKIVYRNLGEIAMGAPLGGESFLEIRGVKKAKIHSFCGGPPVWESKGQLVALPTWTRNTFKGTVQQISVLDVNSMQLTIFAKIFRVLDLRSFEAKVIKGYDSPIYMTSSVHFDIEQEKVDKIIEF